MSWQAKTLEDLMIEVWEKLDCESVGAAEIEAIEEAVAGVFGSETVPAPMAIARTLADEGAVLRHSELMELHIRRFSERTYEADIDGLFDLSGPAAAISTFKRIERLRERYRESEDKRGLSLLRKAVIEKKEQLERATASDAAFGLWEAELLRWFSIWMQTPDLIEDWVRMRARSAEYIANFGQLDMTGK